MNRENIIKLNNKPHKIKKWWNKNQPLIFRIIFFYIYIPYLIHDKIKTNNQNNFIFNEDKCKKYLDKVIPKMFIRYASDIDNVLISTNNEYCDFTFRDFRWNNRFKKKYKNFFDQVSSETLMNYIMDKYEIEGYNKIVLTKWTDWNITSKFGWFDNYDKDYDKGVIFYIDNK